MPISDTCTSAYDDKVVMWPVTYDAKVLALTFIDSISQKPKFLPLAIPKDLAHRITRFNGDPSSWWIGQMLKYILKPRQAMQKAINDTIAKMNFKKPIVGVHIRRTDKVGTEAAFHHIHEYMVHVKDYYDQLELTRPVDVRRVYLATDDANVGRVAYEMMQTNRVDASDSFFSLDDIYYFGGQNAHDRVAVLPNDGAYQDIPFQVGDLIGIAGNHWNGYGRGTNKRTNVNGLIPWYKTADHLVLYPFPEYKQVPLYTDTRQKDL
ncbi:hypothetical protein HF086_005633 [Spodoptera exigua]|uniref:GT23 domain-containing protein n=1 Tax=Spodoptera exigua TaxID=7107 RepID=A0A922MY42_SPOEX|nr:hypothetical protein HF086_005633 [Spodoptera exigua]